MPWSSRCPLSDGEAGPKGPALRGEGAVGITQAALETIAEHARAEHPRECCGLLIGTAGTILRAVPVENTAVDPFRRYEIAPAAYLHEIRRGREEGTAVVGAYHSHPRSEPVPSPTDLEMAFSDFLFVIAGPVTDAPELDVRAYLLGEARFQEVTLSVL